MEKLAGFNRREKFRIRFYNNDLSYIRLEKKSKINSLCYKEGHMLTLSQCQGIINGDFSVLKEGEVPLLMELYSKIHSQQLRPKSVVDYEREAFIYLAGNVRITFDRDIRASNNTSNFLSPELVTIPAASNTIMEIKYDEFIPEIIRQSIKMDSRNVTEFSKYVVSRFV